MIYSYSRVDCFVKCPYQFKLRYIDELQTLDEYDPQDALKLGTAIHKGIETDVETAIKEYYGSYPVITDKHIEEAIKLEYLIPKVKARLPNGLHEVEVIIDNYKGYLDLICPVKTENGIEYYDLYDFKYSNNINNYLESKQLHVYKYYFEKANPTKKINRMYFVFVPKCLIRLKKTEEQYQFRKRIIEELSKKDIRIEEIIYDKEKVNDFKKAINDIETCTNFEKNETRLCAWCQYYNYCLNGDMLDIVEKKWYEK